MSLLTATAWAQEAAATAQPKGPSLLEALVMPLGFLVIMYFLVIRPQQRKAKEQASLLTNLKAGDEVVTSGGLIGKIRSVAETFVSLEIAPNMTVKVVKSNIAALTKPPAAQPVASEKPAKA